MKIKHSISNFFTLKSLEINGNSLIILIEKKLETF